MSERLIRRGSLVRLRGGRSGCGAVILIGGPADLGCVVSSAPILPGTLDVLAGGVMSEQFIRRCSLLRLRGGRSACDAVLVGGMNSLAGGA
ncbi:hypothetical protein GCM10010397_78450 [Streptomyces spinoverrucosus]|nr:hypothetical protein GCM10010397_78450 [Streptomyces spinoverrucosus]